MKSRGYFSRQFDTLSLYLFLLFSGFAILIALADRAPLELETVANDVLISERFVYYWQGVVFRFFPGPYVYRILIPYLLWGINRLTTIDLISIDLITKIVLILLAQFTLFRYLFLFFKKLPSLLGVFIFNALLGFLLSFIKGPSVIETIDLLNIVVITVGLIAIFKKEWLLLGVVLLVGLLNRETPLILLPVLFLYESRGDKKIGPMLVVSLIALAAFLLPRLMIPVSGEATWLAPIELLANLPIPGNENPREALIANVRLAILIGPLLIIGLLRFSEQPAFLKLAAYMLPVLIAIHFTTGRIIETRLWLPIFPFLIPLSIHNLSRLAKLRDTKRSTRA